MKVDMRGMRFKAAVLGMVVLAGGVEAKEQGEKGRPWPVVYRHEGYGLKFGLPESWRGYRVLERRWAEMPGEGEKSEEGPMVVLRHPKWTKEHPYHDIPILIFTRKQWEEKQGDFAIYAGGVAMEISHNERYVFGVWSRFNWDDETPGAEEVGKIVERNAGENRHLPMREGK